MDLYKLIFYSLPRFLAFFVRAIVYKIVAIQLGSSALANLGSLQNLTQALRTIGSLGLTTFLYREYQNPQSNKEKEIAPILLIATFSVTIASCAAYFIYYDEVHKLFIFLFISVLFGVLTDLCLPLFRVYLPLKWFSLIYSIGSIISILVIYVIIYWFHVELNLGTSLLVFNVSALISVILAFLYLKVSKDVSVVASMSLSTFKKSFKFIKSSAPYLVFISFVVNVAYFEIKGLVVQSNVNSGVYESIYQLCYAYPLLGLQGFGLLYYPRLLKGDMSTTCLYRSLKMTQLFIWLILPIMYLFSRELLELFFNKEISDYYNLLRVFLLSIPFMNLWDYSGTALIGIGKERQVLFLNILLYTTVYFVYYFLIDYGLEYVLLGHLLALIACALITFFSFRYYVYK